MASPAWDVAGADEALVRYHAAELAGLAARHGITNLRFASPGRLLGTVATDRDLIDIAEFMAEAEDLLGAPVTLFSDAVLGKDRVSDDLLHAAAL